jgi:serine/threonine-protein kinase
MAVNLIGRDIKARYRVIDERGRGNFGSVYLVRDILTNYIYAMKVMVFEQGTDRELVERFMREALILYNINDLHIVRVVDYGNEGTLYYIIMHHIDGQNLKYYMQHYGKMEPLRALDYIHQIAEGLEAAHQHGVVHRDIKPQNILVNNKGIVKIVDFGLSRSREMLTITQSDKFMGTAYYVAPEQIISSHEVDTRADLYALTVVFFEMMAGEPPYTKGRALDIILQHTKGEIPSLCERRPELPEEVDLFVQKAMARVPDDRFQTPAEYILAVEQLQILVRSAMKQQSMPLAAVPYPGGQGSSYLAAVEPTLRAPQVNSAPLPPGNVPAAPLSSLPLAGQPLSVPQPVSVPFGGQPQANLQGGPAGQVPGLVSQPVGSPMVQPARLVLQSGGQIVQLQGANLLVGRLDPRRETHPDIVLDDPDKTVGRVHACLAYRQGRWSIEDRNSRNKTRLNGAVLTPFEPQPLNHGDRLRFGRFEARFELG